MAIFKNPGIFAVHPHQKERFISGELWREWVAQYRNMLFDEDDYRLAENQAALGYHFYERLAAILIFQSMGYYSLVEEYEFKKHKRKQNILHQLVSADLLALIDNRETYGNVQCPDLLAYAPDFSDWFFCEVKGPKDRLRSRQEDYFRAIVEVTGKSIRLIEFHYASGGM